MRRDDTSLGSANSRFTADGPALRDGKTVPLDLVVVATGYETQQGFDDGGVPNMWTLSPPRGAT